MPNKLYFHLSVGRLTPLLNLCPLSLCDKDLHHLEMCQFDDGVCVVFVHANGQFVSGGHGIRACPWAE